MKLQDRPHVGIRFDRVEITLNVSKTDTEEAVNFFQELKPDVDYELTAKERAKRSLNANNYHWCLTNKLASAMGVSNYEIHNQLLSEYGEDWVDENGEKSYVLMKDDDSYRRMDKMHFRPTEHVETRNGKEYRWFILLLPSHLMDRKQMARLINGTVSECEAVGISTKPPEDIDKMLERWGQRDDREGQTRK